MYVFYGAQCLHRKILVETSSGDGVPESSMRGIWIASNLELMA